MKRTNFLWIVTLVLGWLFDFLFWKHARGSILPSMPCLPGRRLPGVGTEWHQALLEVPAPAHPHPVLRSHDLHPPGTAQHVPVVRLYARTDGPAGGHLPGRALALVQPVGLRGDYLKLAGSLIARPVIFLVGKEKAGRGNARSGCPSFTIRAEALLGRPPRGADRPAHRRRLRRPALLRRPGLRPAPAGLSSGCSGWRTCRSTSSAASTF